MTSGSGSRGDQGGAGGDGSKDGDQGNGEVLLEDDEVALVELASVVSEVQDLLEEVPTIKPPSITEPPSGTVELSGPAAAGGHKSEMAAGASKGSKAEHLELMQEYVERLDIASFGALLCVPLDPEARRAVPSDPQAALDAAFGPPLPPTLAELERGRLDAEKTGAGDAAPGAASSAPEPDLAALLRIGYGYRHPDVLVASEASESDEDEGTSGGRGGMSDTRSRGRGGRRQSSKTSRHGKAEASGTSPAAAGGHSEAPARLGGLEPMLLRCSFDDAKRRARLQRKRLVAAILPPGKPDSAAFLHGLMGQAVLDVLL